jgi:hypothetical protein
MDPRRFLSSTPERSAPPTARRHGAPVRKEDRQPADRPNERGPAYSRASAADNLASGCNAGVPMSGKARALRAASRGQVLPLVDGGTTRERCLPPVPGKAMSGQAQVYRPLAGGNIVCTSPSPASTGRAGGIVNARSHRLRSCLTQTTVHLVRPGTCHPTMVQVRVLARCLLPCGLLPSPLGGEGP